MFVNRIKRGDDLPLTCRIIREGKGKYVCMVTFTASKRHYGDEYVFAKNLKAVKVHIKRLFPSITFYGERHAKLKAPRRPAKDRTPLA